MVVLNEAKQRMLPSSSLMRRLLSAVRRGDVAAVSSLLSQSPGLINGGRDVTCEAENEDGWWTPLGLAARLGHMDLIRLLVSKGADLEQTCTGYTGRAPTGRKDVCEFGSKYTPVHLACHARNARALRVLLEGGAKPTALDGDDCSPLYVAARRLSPECVQVLIEMAGSALALDGKNNEEETPMMAAVMALHQAKAREALPRSLRAVYTSASAVIARLLEAGCDPNDVKGASACPFSTALLAALDAGLEDLAMLLVLHGAHLPQGN